ncbi:MAG TPA: toprim domain-containing protein, partial [Rickettsia endosymbiont of Omalisus fontisbellaquei]|nr:toprim domain-containing protein [Rickettsia endosymbiont of Omalisus fontisbellaquei]
MTSNKNHKKATETLKKVKEEKNKVEVKSKKKTIRNTVQNSTESKHTELKEKPEIEKIPQVKTTSEKNKSSEVSISGKSSNLENQKDVSNVKLQDVPSKIEDTNPIASVKQETHQIDKVKQLSQISNDDKKTPNINGKSTAKTQTNKNNKYQENRDKVQQKNPFELVLSSLTSSDYENIFRKYAGNIAKNNEKIKISNEEIFKGSLSMNRSSNKGGVWQLFKSGEVGNIFSFVQTALNCSKEESLKILADAARIELPNHRNNVNYASEPKVQPKVQPQAEKEKNPADEWKAIEPIPESAPKIDRDIHLAFLLKYNIIDGIYTYKNNKNQLLGYTLRLINKQNRAKTVRPLTYCYNEAEKKEDWKLKGFTDKGHKPIFGIEKTVNDDKPILIVEGEKSCRAAQKLLPEYTVISWLGGSMTAGRAQWEQLAGKEVIIFPDNDESGMKAAYTISR